MRLWGAFFFFAKKGDAKTFNCKTVGEALRIGGPSRRRQGRALAVTEDRICIPPFKLFNYILTGGRKKRRQSGCSMQPYWSRMDKKLGCDPREENTFSGPRGQSKVRIHRGRGKSAHRCLCARTRKKSRTCTGRWQRLSAGRRRREG